MASVNLADPGVWDDSALKDSWNEALAEYQKYHSIHVQGRNLSEVLTKEELDILKEGGVSVKNIPGTDPKRGPSSVNGLSSGEPIEEYYEDIEPEVASGAASAEAELQQGGSNVGNTQATIPDGLLGSVQDPSIRNLMMAWYWAGYYTGFREGQQSTKQPLK